MDDLNVALLAALEPVGLAERLGFRVSGGLTAREVLERLPESLQGSLRGAPVVGDPEGVVGARRAVDAVQRALIGLVQEGRVARRQRSAWVELRSKGHRSVVVDVFRSLDKKP